MTKSQHFCFTLFNFDEHLDELRQLINQERTQYLIWEQETCPTTGRRHLQGYIQLVRRTEFSTVRRMFPGTPKLLTCGGSDQDNEDYCTKDNDHIERFGERLTIQAQKKKKSEEVFINIRDDIQNGNSLTDIATQYPQEFIKHHTGIEKLFKMLSKTKPAIYYGPFRWNILDIIDWSLSVILCGPTNIGKTQYAKTLFENPLLIRHIDKLKSFNPLYHGGIIFDDLQFTHWPETAQIHLTDTTDDADINVKHSFVTIPAGTKRVFTCNNNRYPFSGDAAITRRVQFFELE